MRILIVLFSFLYSILNAECLVDYNVMYAIADCENHISRPIGYPYLISFNEAKDAQRAKKRISAKWLDNRTIDCENKKKCESITNEIFKLGILNLDLGAFQINKKSHDFADMDKYFVLKKSYLVACKIVYSHYKETGKWNWETIARYHSKTPKLNKIYAKNLIYSYKKILNLKKENK